MMQQMPDEWRNDMARLLHELDAAYPGAEIPDCSVRFVDSETGRFVKAPQWLIDYRHPDQVKLATARARGAGS